jgi:lipopolysaccharide transport system ATP-binding protein
MVIEFKNVSKRFTLHHDGQTSFLERLTGMFRTRPRGEAFWALRDVSFSVAPGESLGLVGHNGAGKSTTLKLMTRILDPTSGSVRLEGRVAALLELGSGFHPDLSGRENVFLYGSLMGLGRKEMQAKIDEIVEFADIGNFLDTEVKHYSSGMYTRLAFAVATAVDPDILITDEVLAVGDEAFQRKCMERIFNFRRMGKTIIFVSHGLEVVRTLCDQAIWLDHGMARAVGPAGEVVDAYLAEVNRQEQARIKKQRSAHVSKTDADQAAEEDEGEEENLYRRGSREIEIVQVELLDASGNRREVFQTYDAVTIRMHYIAHELVRYPVFGIALHHENGLWLTGPNTNFAGVDLPRVAGTGYIDYHIPNLPLLTGRYLLTVAVYDETMLHPYDHHERMYQVIVQSRGIRERYGIMSLAGNWKWQEVTDSSFDAVGKSITPPRK